MFPEKNFTIRILENASVGSEVINVRAVDTDIGSNGAVRYKIRKDPLGNYKTFHIDNLTGQITLQRPLDRERQKLYEVRVEAHDLGVPTALQSDLDLTIYVRNINDHEPQFIVDQFTVNFTENKAPGTERERILNTVDLDDVDEDEIKLDVCYFVVGGNNEDRFAVNPITHEVMALQMLDREEKDVHILIIKATEECLHQPQKVAEFDSSDDSLLKLIINVNDVNDNAPIFLQSIFTGGISTDIEFGTAFMTITAKDSDDGLNAVLEYSICSDIKPILSEGFDVTKKAPFVIEPMSGEILLNFDPQKNQKGYFSFNVCAQDIGGNHDIAQAYIYLLREDQRVKFIMRSNPGEIRARMLEFRSVLANATDSIVNVDHFRVHENYDGTIDKTKTDVLLHFVNPLDNSIIEVSDILQTLDYKTEELDPFFKEFNVLKTEGANSALVGEKSSTETVIILWLIGMCVFLVITLIVVICVCISQRSQYMRKLKAATTNAYEEPIKRTVAKNEIVPNTNRHASEGSNPVWMSGAGYENWGSQEEEDERYDKQEHMENFDSLDANVLNDSYEADSFKQGVNHHDDIEEEEEQIPDYLKGDVLYSRSHHSGGGSTLLISSKDSSPDRESDSSGRGSGSRIGSGHEKSGYGSINRNLSALFPAGLPPVEKLNNPLASSRLTMEDISIPRTEL